MKKCLILILNASVAAITLLTLRYYLVTKPVFVNDLNMHEPQKTDSGNYSRWPFHVKQDSLIDQEGYKVKSFERNCFKKSLSFDCFNQISYKNTYSKYQKNIYFRT